MWLTTGLEVSLYINISYIVIFEGGSYIMGTQTMINIILKEYIMITEFYLNIDMWRQYLFRLKLNYMC